jgi:hypothetical protein
MNNAIIDFGKFEASPGQSYVALGRVKKLENVLIEYGFDADRITNLKEPEYVAAFEIETEKLIKKTTLKCIKDEKNDEIDNKDDDNNEDEDEDEDDNKTVELELEMEYE